MNPKGNLAMYYYRDPDFYVSVIGKEESPYEFHVKITPVGKHPKPLSIKEIKDVFGKIIVDDMDIMANNYSGFSVRFSLNNTDNAVKVYSKIYDNHERFFNGYKAHIYYQKDIEILERYADEEAEKYYQYQNKNEGRRQTGYGKGNYKKEYDNQRDNRNYNKFGDNDVSSKHDDDTTSQNSLSGFGKPVPKFFNK